MRILVIVPTRGRPESAGELAKTFAETVANAEDTHILFVVDDDDDVEAYAEILSGHSETVHMAVGPRMRMGSTLNRAAVTNVNNFAVIGFQGDDNRFRTKGWDDEARRTVGAMNGSGICYGDDLHQGVHLPTSAFVTSDIIAILGYMVPPELTHLFMDNFWKDFGVEIEKLSFMMDVVIEHMHPVAGKSEWDESYLKTNSTESYELDKRAYEQYKNSRLQWDVLRYNIVTAGIQTLVELENDSNTEEEETA